MKALSHLAGAVVMVAGAGLVLGLMVWMNGHARPPPKPPKAAGTSVVVAPPPPKKDKPKSKPKPERREQRRRATPRTPPPSLASSLSSVSLGGAASVADLSGAGDSAIGDTSRDLVMTEEAVDQPPRPVQRPPLQYPAELRARGITGHVTLRLLVGADGSVERVKLVDSTPPGAFDQLAREAATAWRFEPARYKGQPVKTWAKQTIRFDLRKG